MTDSLAPSAHPRMGTLPSPFRAHPDMPSVLVATSAFGHRMIAQQGQAAMLPCLSNAGADGVEIRRELLPEDFDDFDALGRACDEHGLTVVYSAADELWSGDMLSPSLPARLDEAAALGAVAIKLSLGHYPGTSTDTWQRLSALIAASPVAWVMVENDQTRDGGTVAPLLACLEDATGAGCPLHMTFDIGNWHWTGDDPVLAADRLGRFVAYVHCKGIVFGQGRPHASVPDLAEMQAWQQLMSHFPRGVPRAIEYPLQAPELTGFVREQLERLRAL